MIDEILSLPLSKIYPPVHKALSDIEKTTLALSSRQPALIWLDPGDVDWFLLYNPVIVRPVSRHYEVVAGFRAYHAAKSILNPDELMTVQLLRKVDMVELIKGAFYELASHSLMHTTRSKQESVNTYVQLRKLSLILRKEHEISLPEKLCAKSLKSLFGIESKEIRPPRRRKSQLTRLMEG